MFSKFESFMTKYLTPLLIIGSFCLIPKAVPNMIGESHPISV